MTFVESSAAFMLGVMGSAHCVSMCGPISTTLCAATTSSERARDVERKVHLPLISSSVSDWKARGATHAGRLTTYIALGSLAGTLGAGFRHFVALAVIQLGARIAAAAVLVAAGLYVAGLFRRFGTVERFGAPFFARIGQWLHHAESSGLLSRYARGAAWGLLPCGLVMSAIALAVVSGSPLRGGLTLAIFGGATLPTFALLHEFASRFGRWLRHAAWRRAAGLLIVVSGLVQMSVAVAEARILDQPEAPRPCCAHREAVQAAEALRLTATP